MDDLSLGAEHLAATLAAFLGAGCIAYLILGLIIGALRGALPATIRGAPARARRMLRGRDWPLVGLSLVMASPAYAASRSDLPPSRRTQVSPEPPWSGGTGSPPPRLVLRTEAPPSVRTRPHPAIHRVGAGSYRVGGPLFARAGEHPARSSDTSSLHKSMAAHPAGKSSRASTHAYTVRDGDKLWSIAAIFLRTDDAARIARYWPRIHRANRSVIGRDPNLIFPGQVLHLPAELE